MNSIDPVATPSATPYSERWPQILRYPMHLGALSTILAIAIAHLVGFIPVICLRGFALERERPRRRA